MKQNCYPFDLHYRYCYNLVNVKGEQAQYLYVLCINPLSSYILNRSDSAQKALFSSGIVFQKLTVAQQVNNFSVLYGNTMFIKMSYDSVTGMAYPYASNPHTHTSTPYVFKINFNDILTYTLKFSKRCPPSLLSTAIYTGLYHFITHTKHYNLTLFKSKK
jgi:hypothetical protein